MTVGAVSIVRYSAGIASNAARLAHRVELAPPARRPARARWPRRRPRPPSPNPVAPRRISPIERERSRVGRIERRPPAARAAAPRRVSPLALLDGRELAIEERAVGRRRDRALVAVRASSSRPASAALRAARDRPADAAEAQHVDAAAQPGSVGIGRQRGLERCQRRIASGRARAAPRPARQRRRVRGVGRERAIEVRRRRPARPCAPARVPEPRFGRIEVRRRLQDRGERRARPRAYRRPGDSSSRIGTARQSRRPASAAGQRRKDELGKLRRRDGRRRAERLRRARDASAEQVEDAERGASASPTAVIRRRSRRARSRPEPVEQPARHLRLDR